MPVNDNEMVQQAFTEMCEVKKKIKIVKKTVKDAYAESKPYKDAEEEVKAAKEKLARIKEAINESLKGEKEALQDLDDEVKSVGVAVETTALRLVLNGETVKVSDLSGRNFILKPTVKAEKDK